jgi:endonuclease YncB( thermonuclease family)
LLRYGPKHALISIKDKDRSLHGLFMLTRSIFVAIALAARSAAFADDLVGQASVIDGDTIEIHGTRIRIFGIDAPESDQLCRNEESELYRCGQKASNALFDFIARRPIECVEVDRDRYNPHGGCLYRWGHRHR